MSTETYTVQGMTCGHCVSSVTEEVSELPGVSDVQVDLASGQVTITADEPVGAEKVRVAVEEAGYSLAAS
jgi:copper chaperone